MEVKELRIGNYIETYLGIQKTTIKELVLIWNKQFDAKPIPLTEEWLLKFGFKKDTDDSFIFNSLAIFLDKRFKKNVCILTSEYSKNWLEIDLKIKHVHQLQNLYFALTEKELIC